MLTSPCFEHKENTELNRIELHGQEGLARYCALKLEIASSQHAIGNNGRGNHMVLLQHQTHYQLSSS